MPSSRCPTVIPPTAVSRYFSAANTTIVHHWLGSSPIAMAEHMAQSATSAPTRLAMLATDPCPVLGSPSPLPG